MAVISGGEQSIYKITKWLGLNENPDGDTDLKTGEAAELQNFRITNDRSLQLRPGYMTIVPKGWEGEVRGVWSGRVGVRECVVFAAGGLLYELDIKTRSISPILGGGTAFADRDTAFFGFAGRLYIQNGAQYLEWDGENAVKPVEGYRPLLIVASPPGGGGTELEQINKLTGARRVWFSPDGTTKVFKLPETDISGVDYVKYRSTGAAITAFTVDAKNGTVTFTAAPTLGTSSLEIGYTHSVSKRAEVEAMRFSEIFNGSTDNRVFLYGNGSNMAIYSGLDYDGNERADYFPDLNVLHVGTANTPITGMIRHYSRLAVFKADSAYSITYGTITLEDGRVTSAFYITPTNRAVGNEAAGQVVLVENSPRTLTDGTVVEWRNGSGYVSNLTTDERQARVISDRVQKTLSGMDLQAARVFFDRVRREHYICCGGTAVINGVATDTWYVYTDFDISHLFSYDGELYGFVEGGGAAHISRRYQNDDGRAIKARWRSGSIAFARDWQRKFSSRVFLTMRPESRSRILVSLLTNRKAAGEVRSAASGLIDLRDISFCHWSFGTNRRPQVKKLRLRAKKFAYCQLSLESDSDWSTATVLAADIKLRYGGETR